MATTQDPRRDGPTEFTLSAEWRAAFKAQYSDEMAQRLHVFAADRLAGIGNRDPRRYEQQAREVVQGAIFDTLHGTVRWYPERKDLEWYFQDVIKRRTSMDWTRTTRIREVSLDATTADGRSPILEEVERVLLERFPDPVGTANAARALAEIEEIAQADPDFAAFIEARSDNLRASAVREMAGLSIGQYRRCRRLLAQVLDRLSIRVRAGRKKRGG
jgi:hypothetical protein